MPSGKKRSDPERKAQFLAEVQRDQAVREKSYREQALKIYPHVCGRCCREFSGKGLRELTVHHRDHNHINNPPDGSNWENLCVYCHEDVHSRSVMAEHLGDNISTKEFSVVYEDNSADGPGLMAEKLKKALQKNKQKK